MARYVPNVRFVATLLNQALMHRFMDRLGDAGLEFAEQHVAVDTGELKDSLHVEQIPGAGRRIVAGTDHWQYPEYEGQPYLRPIPEALGLRRGVK